MKRAAFNIACLIIYVPIMVSLVMALKASPAEFAAGFGSGAISIAFLFWLCSR